MQYPQDNSNSTYFNNFSESNCSENYKCSYLYKDKTISYEYIEKLDKLGLIPTKEREYNVGESNYSKHIIQPWSIWMDYPELTSWDHDIIKRVLRTKSSDTRKMDYEKIIHICNERIRQLNFD